MKPLIADSKWFKPQSVCPLCNEDPGPFPMKWSARGWVCRDCYGAYDLGRFEEAPKKHEEES